MNEIKNVWKKINKPISPINKILLYVALSLVIISLYKSNLFLFQVMVYIILFFFLNDISTLIHEWQHELNCKKYDVKGRICLRRILGGCFNLSKKEEQKLYRLKNNAKKDIFLSGIKSDISIIILSLLIILILLHLNIKQKKFLFFPILSTIFLIAMIIFRVSDIYGAVSKKNGDLGKLIRVIKN